MQKEILDWLKNIREEEQDILDGGKNYRERFFGDGKSGCMVDIRKMMEPKSLISVRPHIRFMDFPEHTHNYVEVMYVCQGSISHIINGKEIRMHTGELLFLNQYAKHQIRKSSVDDIAVNLIIRPDFFDLPLEMLEKNNSVADFLVDILRKDAYGPQYLYFKVGEVLQIQNLMENIILSLLKKEEHENTINKITMGLIFSYLVQNVDCLATKLPHNYKELIHERTMRYIELHYKNATLGELAGELSMTIYTLSRTIKQEFGHTFKEMLQEKRMHQAAKLLQDTDLVVNDIVAAVGYENNSYFYRKFREKYGTTPDQYRKRCK